MTCYKVEADFNATLVGFVDQSHQVCIRAKTGIHLVIVNHIVATIEPSRLKDRIQPKGIHANRLDVVKFLYYARQVADAIAITVHIR